MSTAAATQWGIPQARHGLDGWLCGAIATLLIWGLIMVASASVAQAEKLTGEPYYFFLRQLVFLGLGGAIGFAIYCVPMQQWQRSSTWLYLFAIGLLLFVLIPGIGIKVNAARRWIDQRALIYNTIAVQTLSLTLPLAGPSQGEGTMEGVSYWLQATHSLWSPPPARACKGEGGGRG